MSIFLVVLVGGLIAVIGSVAFGSYSMGAASSIAAMALFGYLIND